MSEGRARCHHVTICEVGPRDGLQNESGVVPTTVKAGFIRRLLAAGLPVVEATASSSRVGCPSSPTPRS